MKLARIVFEVLLVSFIIVQVFLMNFALEHNSMFITFVSAITFCIAVKLLIDCIIWHWNNKSL